MSVILRVGAVKPSGGQELHYGSGDEASSSYTDADVLDIPLPEHTYQRPLPPTSTHAHSGIGYFGLPYQDHNYGMPPPPSPPRPASPRPPSPLQVNGVVQMEEEVKTTPLVSVVEEVVEDSITRCICGYLHDDGYMICCDKCSVWQHIDCMGVDRNNIPESYYCELCQPRILDAVKAKVMQKRKREELAARNVLSDSSATDTDPEEAANALASMGRKLPASKKKGLKQKRNSKLKDKPPLKLKIGKALAQKKAKKPGKKEKENIKATKPKKMFKLGSQKMKSGKNKNRPLLTLEQLSADPWNSNLSPWVDSYEHAHENQYSPAVREFSSNSHLLGQTVDISSIISDQLLVQLTCVADVKKNRKGLKATQEIPAGQAIIEYKGKVMLRHDYDKEHSFVNSFKKLQPFVLFYSKLDVDLCVDARTYGNEARFVRRSCSPNSEVQHIFSQGQMYFVVLSKKHIMVDSEITIPFDYNYEDCSYCVECACNKNNCVISRYWKRLKNAQKPSTKDLTVRRKRQSSGGEEVKNILDDGFNSSSSQGSPAKASASPIKSLQMKVTETSSPPKLNSPIKSNVSTLLAASALLDGQPDLASSLQLEVPESLPQVPPPPAPPPPPPKSATSSRRGSRLSEDSVKEEKPVFTQTKEKHKVKESKHKDKESKEQPHIHLEIKKERRPSSRRQSQEEPEEIVNHKSEVPESSVPPGNEGEDSNSASDCPRKMTREERKLDAIMKAFEKMEKREERRKEAMARGDTGSKKGPGDSKSKKEDNDGNSSCGSNIQSRSASQDGHGEGGDNSKLEPGSDDQQEMKSPAPGGDVKPESSSGGTPPSGSGTQVASTVAVPDVPSGVIIQETIRPVKEESPQKPVRKSGKRKRRRSRVQSTTVLSDAASVSTDEGNSNSSFPVGPLSMPATPLPTPVSTPIPSADLDGGMFKYIKTKKHLFEEWSNKQEDENSKQEEEMFVQCLPNSHVNTMDHLQRRNSHSAGCYSKGSESSVGSAKKRWLRQAMHEDPAPVAYHHSLSVSTDSGGGSPVHGGGGASPNPGAGLSSPGAGSPLDFVTPLKKRRLMRESLSGESNGPTASAGMGVLAENFTSNSISGILPKSNGVKPLMPAHRHSTDDRWLLHKGFPHQNGFREIVTLTDGVRSRTAAATHSRLNIASTPREVNGLEIRSTVSEQRAEYTAMPVAETSSIPVTIPHVNGISEAMPISSVSFTQPISKYPLKFRGIFERMEVDSSDETSKEREIQPIASSSRVEERGIHISRPSCSRLEDDTEIDSSASTSTVVVVNSSVYNGVNNLMDEGSEAGCVTAKSIMDVDSPATVRIDLNAHEMEPSSLSDGSAVVSLDDRLFNRCGRDRDKRIFDTPNECQVNSSEDVETLPLVTEGRNSDICDNVCTDSSSAQVVIRQREHDGEQTVDNNSVEEEGEIVDSSQHVNRNNVSEGDAVFERQNVDHASVVEDLPGTSSSSCKPDAECISSSGQTSTSEAETDAGEHSVVCDSAEAASDNISELDEASRPCDTGSVNVEVNVVHGPDADENSVDGEEVRTCDSVGGNVAFAVSCTSRSAVSSDTEEGVGDSAVSESHCSDQQFAFASAGESNVDSTSSENNRLSSQQSIVNSSSYSEDRAADAVAVDGCCDSNYERQPTSNAMGENSATGDESSLEGLGVSSSNVNDSQSTCNATWENYSKRQLTEDADNAVSTVTQEYNAGIAESASTSTEASSVAVPPQEDSSTEIRPSSSGVNRDSTPSTPNSTVASSSVASTSEPLASSPLSPPLSSSSSLSSLTVMETATSSMSPSAPASFLTTTTASSTAAVPVTSSPPISSTAEATPAKKKVSLLEYRKRLKEKPAPSTAETTKSSTVAAASTSPSSSSSTVHHHKLSTTLSMFLASSSPTTSSTSSTSPSKSSSSHSHSHKKQRMPTLATLPLFKSADHKNKKEEEKKKHKPKPEKQLSLTERLRLEFGLEDCGDEATKKKKGEESEVASSNGAVDDPIPPPPPPAVGSSYPAPAAAAGFVASSTHPRAGFHGSQAPLMNGGPGSYFNYHQQQQPSISSTSLSTPPLPSQHGGRDRQAPGFSGQNGPPGPVSSRMPVAPYPPHHHQQQPSSSSLSSTSHVTPPSQPHTWPLNQGPSSSSSAAALSSTNPHHGPSPSLQFDYNHRQLSQSQTVVSGNIVPDDHPPPPPPPPPRPHHRLSSASSSSSSSSSHRHHHHSSIGKSKSSKAATSPSSSSSSSRYFR